MSIAIYLHAIAQLLQLQQTSSRRKLLFQPIQTEKSHQFCLHSAGFLKRGYEKGRHFCG